VIRGGAVKGANEGKHLTIPTIAITQTLKLSLLLKKEFSLLCGDIIFKKERSKTATE
jgi:hypothetical protein